MSFTAQSFTGQHALLRQAIRTEVRQRRKQLTQQQQQVFALEATQRIATHPRIVQAETLSVFLSFDGELDTAPLIDRLWQDGKKLYLPVLHPSEPGHLLFLRYTAETPLVRNRLNILEPVLEESEILPLEQLDIILTPLVAFDSQGQRLGMGGGFYDRTLANWRERGPYPIGIAHDCQWVEALPIEEWDVPLPEILTPGKSWRWEHESPAS
ncbi:5-formyltetrahydrofolate cyclo-ligase [Rouxiella chamberiensis]|uniref:5-formyltetrahydrofolate cyclo-ligase n=1 Tax=Rouxiella chamberiensis TaxID=1513468 RepID=A0ABY7HP24_9GAMM|nr:5-formyltetrahydrofolate cyclo-ligase [Rouxiella chamberiensis]WAT01145.1 5-formyltetrahydrofolate cyclo-ligase [Rouxiella chamberiensis]